MSINISKSHANYTVTEATVKDESTYEVADKGKQSVILIYISLLAAICYKETLSEI